MLRQGQVCGKTLPSCFVPARNYFLSFVSLSLSEGGGVFLSLSEGGGVFLSLSEGGGVFLSLSRSGAGVLGLSMSLSAPGTLSIDFVVGFFPVSILVVAVFVFVVGFGQPVVIASRPPTMQSASSFFMGYSSFCLYTSGSADAPVAHPSGERSRE